VKKGKEIEGLRTISGIASLHAAQKMASVIDEFSRESW